MMPNDDYPDVLASWRVRQKEREKCARRKAWQNRFPWVLSAILGAVCLIIWNL